MDLDRLRSQLAGVATAQTEGRVQGVSGLALTATLPGARVGDVISIARRGSPLLAEVVGFRGGEVVAMPLGDLTGIGPDDPVKSTSGPLDVVVSDGLLGRVLDIFVVAQLRADCVVSALSPRLFHVRDANGRHEVDILAEFPDGSVVGFEVKADAAPGSDAARHLRWLKDALGDRFVAGVVMHTGPRPWRIDGDIYAVPICALWG